MMLISKVGKVYLVMGNLFVVSYCTLRHTRMQYPRISEEKNACFRRYHIVDDLYHNWFRRALFDSF